MSHLKAEEDECFILVKALPHLSSNYAETVCCAGIGHDAKWRRLYPVQFRILDDNQKFKRWQWISYRYTTSKKDPRKESQKVVPESIHTGKLLGQSERIAILNSIMRKTLDEADTRTESLVLLRPQSIEFGWIAKTKAQIEDERQKHAALANQLSLLDAVKAPPLTPCPYQFSVKWTDQNKTKHTHVCDDWETSTAFFVRRKSQSNDESALSSLKQTYEQSYMNSGMAMAFSTHSRRNVTHGMENQWLLVGLIRIDESKQGDLLAQL
ncbi:MAG: hypothetical protein VX640_06765 [Pseudomonadota bacterium]|nr:hypothetical protein [Pseudomonadota bacterium]